MHNIICGKCPNYFNHYIRYVKNKHCYTTQASIDMNLSTPFFSTVTGKCSFLASGTRLWNNLDSATRGLTSLCKFKNQLYKKYIDWNFYFAFLLFEFEVLVDHNENYWFYQ